MRSNQGSIWCLVSCLGWVPLEGTQASSHLTVPVYVRLAHQGKYFCLTVCVLQAEEPCEAFCASAKSGMCTLRSSLNAGPYCRPESYNCL